MYRQTADGSRSSVKAIGLQRLTKNVDVVNTPALKPSTPTTVHLVYCANFDQCEGSTSMTPRNAYKTMAATKATIDHARKTAGSDNKMSPPCIPLISLKITSRSHQFAYSGENDNNPFAPMPQCHPLHFDLVAE